jgi:hypothetical protein
MSIGDSIPKVPDRFPEDLRKTLYSCLEIEVARRPQTIELYKITTKHVAEQDQAQSHLSPSATSTLHKVSARIDLENVAVNDGRDASVSLPSLIVHPLTLIVLFIEACGWYYCRIKGSFTTKTIHTGEGRYPCSKMWEAVDTVDAIFKIPKHERDIQKH